MDKRLIVTIAVCAGIGILWTLLFMPQKQQPPARPTGQPPPKPVTVAPTAPVMPPKNVRVESVETDDFIATLTNVGAGLVSFQLKKFKASDRAKPMELTGMRLAPEKGSLGIEMLGDPALVGVGEALFEGPVRSAEKGEEILSYRYKDPRLEIEKKYRFPKNGYLYYVDVRVKNATDQALRTQLALRVSAWQNPNVSGGGFFAAPPDIQTPICYVDKSVERESLSDLEKAKKTLPAGKEGTLWAGIDLRYFLSAVLVANKATHDCVLVFDKPTGLVTTYLRESRAGMLAKGQEHSSSYAVFMGPKTHDMLEKITVKQGDRVVSPLLDKAVDFGFVAFLARPMLWLLKAFYDFVGNYGIAIIFLTIVVKLLLLYWTVKSYKSMRAMGKLKPKMDELRVKYKNDKGRLNQEMMSLYKTHKVNPLGGCLPMLLQMPVWIALYRTIYGSVELYQAPFAGWIEDLSAQDPFYVLPILLGASMFLQQKMSPTTLDSTQAKIFLYVMPAMFTVFMLFLPAGLTLYIFVNTLLSILQQWYMNKKAA